jgi:hypothetical protein
MPIVDRTDIRGCAMKAGKRERFVEENSVLQNERARAEIGMFLRALDSYPEQFVRDPQMTFEEYCTNLIRSKEGASRSDS